MTGLLFDLTLLCSRVLSRSRVVVLAQLFLRCLVSRQSIQDGAVTSLFDNDLLDHDVIVAESFEDSDQFDVWMDKTSEGNQTFYVTNGETHMPTLRALAFAPANVFDRAALCDRLLMDVSAVVVGPAVASPLVNGNPLSHILVTCAPSCSLLWRSRRECVCLV